MAAGAELGGFSRFYKSRFLQVIAGLVLGIVLGMAVPSFATELKFFSDAFLKLITMIVAPIVFCVVVHGIAGAGDLKKVGRVGVKALIYFEVMTTVALTVGLALAFLVGHGHGMNVDPSTLDPKALATHAENVHRLAGGGIGLVLVLSVDWFIGIARAVGNLIGNCVATVVIAAWEKDLDLERAKAVLASGDEEVEAAAA
jgi:Na+/H+-dicarboxylate symporter